MWFKPISYIFFLSLSFYTPFSLNILFILCTLTPSMSFHIFFLPKLFHPLSLSVPLLSRAPHGTTHEVKWLSNATFLPVLNVDLNCVGYWQCWYIQQLCDALCVCVSQRREFLKANAALSSSSSFLFISIYHLIKICFFPHYFLVTIPPPPAVFSCMWQASSWF